MNLRGSQVHPTTRTRSLVGLPRKSAAHILQPEHGWDVTAYLTLWVIWLFGVSARQVVPGFGAIGSPALLLLLPVALWWCAGRAVPSLGADRSPNLVRVVLLLHAWYMLFTYAMARTRPLTSLELTGSTRAAITTIALTGLALIVLDGISSTERLTTLLRRVLWGAAFMSLIGALQFFTSDSWQFSLPGLTWNTEAMGAGVETRSIFNRPRGTALHPIEFSVVTAALLPLGIHFLMHSPKGSRRQAAIAATLVIGLGIPFSISRSGILAVVVALAVMFTGWNWRQRANGAVALLASVPVLWMSVPGLVGTLRSMFTWFDEDPSVQSRRDRVPWIMRQFQEHPWFGLGNGTWSIEDYFLIDNQLYVTLLESGVIGLALTITLIIVGMITGLRVAHAPGTTPELTSLARAMTAGIAAISVSIITFDAFHYRILTGILFLFIGANASLLREVSIPSVEGVSEARLAGRP